MSEDRSLQTLTPPAEPRTAPPSRDQPENPVLVLGCRDPVWYHHLRPGRAPVGARSHSWDRATYLTPSSRGVLNAKHLLARFLRRVYLQRS